MYIYIYIRIYMYMNIYVYTYLMHTYIYLPCLSVSAVLYDARDVHTQWVTADGNFFLSYMSHCCMDYKEVCICVYLCMHEFICIYIYIYVCIYMYIYTMDYSLREFFSRI
jgi:hypothetical protein